MMVDPLSDAWIQYGSLSIVALVVFTTLRYLTRSLNGKFDRLSEAIQSNEEAHTAATKENTGALRALRDSVERLNRVP